MVTRTGTPLTALPEVSGARPVLGHMAELGRDRIGFLSRAGREVDRVARLRSVLSVPVVFVNHPEVLHELLVERAQDFEKSLMLRFSLYPLAGEGLFTSRGALWRRQRRLMAPLFQPAQLARYADDMIACAERGLDGFRDGEELPLLRETTRITMAIAGRTLFHTDTFSEADELGQALTVALAWAADNAPSVLSIGHLFTRSLFERAGRRWPAPWLEQAAERLNGPVLVPGPEGRRLREAVAVLDRKVAAMIDARRRAPEAHDDLLARLLAVRDEDGAPMSDRQVRDEVLTLFVAGHETTATALAWTVYALCKHPALYAAVEREVDALGRDPVLEDLPRLDLTLRVFKETLRLYPPVFGLARQTLSPSVLDGVDCPPYTVALFSAFALHRRPDLWPDPERFDPDRFLPEVEAARPRLAWLPFGAGPRVCIGLSFALMEAQLVLGRLLRHLRFALVGADEGLDPQATLRPRHGVRVRVRRRPRAARAVVG